MSRPSSIFKAKLLLIALAAAATIALAPPAPLALDIDVKGGSGGHAVLRVGFASMRVAFGSGQRCSNPDTCAAPAKLGAPAIKLARDLLKLGA